MVIVNLVGGLGNQMFQYACGRAISLRSGQALHLASDQLANYPLHNGYEIDRVFDVEAKSATSDELSSMLGWQSNEVIRWLIGRPKMRWLTCKHFFCEASFAYSPEILNISGPIYLHGYWQSDKYFSEFKDIIRKDFSFKSKYDELDYQVYCRMNENPSVSLHVRRGDYQSIKNKKLYTVCSVQYYVESLSLIRASVPNVKVFVFTDDPDWVAINLGRYIGEYELVRHNLGIRSANDMRLMASANHNIIANSSFSWWGAWLNKNKDKIVISPKRWFLDSRDESTLVPDGWLKV